MKRDPSIHIKKSDLRKILLAMKYGEKNIDEIFRRAKPYSLNTRTVMVSSEFIEKKAKRLTQASRYDADLFARLIYVTRLGMKHRGIAPIKSGGKNWDLLKEVTAHALDFNNEFKLEKKVGFTLYIEVGLSKIKKFNLNKFLGMYEGICETYQSKMEIQHDNDPDTTNKMYRIFAQYILEHTGVYDNLEELPDRYVWFVRAREQAMKMNVSVLVYMKAQLDVFDFTRGIPYPAQLVGPKANERVYRYMHKEGIKIEK